MAEAKSTSPNPTETEAEDESTASWWTFKRAIIVAFSIFVGTYVLIFLIGLVAAIIWNESAASFFRYFRDLMTIALAISSAMIVIATGILIVQIARFINLIRSEVKPITDDTKQAIRNVRVTSEFVQKHAVEPIIQVQSFLAGLIAFLREIILISQVLQRRDSDKNQESDTSTPSETEQKEGEPQ
ncbi:MAG: hypothetical protein Q9P01_10150 [Anaerolineae bacterium]|nr:hypothetical protein [Anaerolineae bacterium]MDQ7035171.1 hypothetical protein [Anaerolineae bacterium]